MAERPVGIAESAKVTKRPVCNRLTGARCLDLITREPRRLHEAKEALLGYQARLGRIGSIWNRLRDSKGDDMAVLRRVLKLFAGRKAGATRGGTPGSHVNKRENKRIANKAVRRSRRIDCLKENP